MFKKTEKKFSILVKNINVSSIKLSLTLFLPITLIAEVDKTNLRLSFSILRKRVIT